MILFFHKNPIPKDKDFVFKNKLFKKDIFIREKSNQVSLGGPINSLPANRIYRQS